MRSFLSLTILFSLVTFSGCLKTRGEVQKARQSGEVQDRLSNLQRQVADRTAEFDQVNADIRQLAGRVENLEAAQQQRQSDSGDQQQALAGQLQEMRQQMALLEQEMTKLSNQVQSLQQNQSSGGNQAGSQELGNFTGAERAFSQKNWKEAILGYEKYREMNPDGRRFAESTYKIGYSFQQLGMKPEARAFYEEVVAKDPKSDWAKQAKAQLKKL